MSFEKEGLDFAELNQMHQTVLESSVKLSCRVAYTELEGEVNFSAGWFEEWPPEQRRNLLENWIAVMQFMLEGEKAMQSEEGDSDENESRH